MRLTLIEEMVCERLDLPHGWNVIAGQISRLVLDFPKLLEGMAPSEEVYAFLVAEGKIIHAYLVSSKADSFDEEAFADTSAIVAAFQRRLDQFRAGDLMLPPPPLEDSRPATWEHIAMVQALLIEAIGQLHGRMVTHDQSKLRDPERATFDKFTPRLRGTTYGSEEYQACLDAMRPALEHHYAHNRHHPEHFAHGIEGMTLIDLVEMLADWKAASMRHDDGCVLESLKKNQKRFGIGDQLLQILENTVWFMAWDGNPVLPWSQARPADNDQNARKEYETED